MAELLPFPSPAAPPPAPAEPPDAAERSRALDIRASWIVEAPAGSGKTGLLIQRFLKLLADPTVDSPEQVLAITFTLKATGEMRDRVLDQLQAAAQGLPPTREFDRLTRPLAEAVLRRDRDAQWSLLDQPRRLNIRTIDSVCAEIARSLPVLSGSGGRLAPTLEASPLYQLAARRTLQQLGGENQPLNAALAALLHHRDANLIDCERLVAAMLARRDQWGQLIPLSPDALEDTVLDATILPQLQRAVELAICQALTQLSRTISPHDLAALTEAAAELGHLDGYQGQPSPIALCAGRTQPPGNRAEHLAHWRALVHLVVTPSSGTWRKSFTKNVIKFDTDTSHRAHLATLVDRLSANEDLLETLCGLDILPPAVYPPEQWAVAKALFRVLAHALAELQLVFAERGLCDFAELGLAARAALTHDAGPEDLAAALGTHTRHLLVDEMQDTSTGQYDLIARLTHGWDGHSQTVFLVGDPKQSIYRFRQARVERFVRTLHEQSLGHLPLGALRLTANFRSQPRLVAHCNHVFARIFPPAIDLAHPEEVPFVAATALRPPGATPGLTWKAQAIPYEADVAFRPAHRRRRTQHDARAVRALAAEWLARPLPPGRAEPWRIAVLVRARAHLATIVAEFKRGAPLIPFRAVEIDPLADRPEVLDLLALTRALLHPADRVAWFAILRAPWCGLALADLHCLAAEGDSALRERTLPDLIHLRGHLLTPDGEARLARVWPVLQQAIAHRMRIPLAQQVERTWRAVGGDTYLAADERENAARFFRLLDELASGNSLDLALLAQRIKRLYADPAVHPGAVDLMTIHGAKGLEWDCVIVPALERHSQADRHPLLDWVEIDAPDSAAHVVLAPIKGTGEDSHQLTEWIRSIHATREAAERKRLLYVACTRAREDLYLFAAPETKSNGAFHANPSSLLKTAWPAAMDHIQPAAQVDAQTIQVNVESAPSATDSQPLPQPVPFLRATPPPNPFGAVLDLAAADEEANATPVRQLTLHFFDQPSPEPVRQPFGPPSTLHRLPLSFDPAARFTPAPLTPPDSEPLTPYLRPEGSFAARAFGNTVHAFLEVAAQHLANGQSAEALQTLVPTWLPRAAAILRSAGLAPALVARLSQRVVESLTNTLASPEGRWVLAPHLQAATEYTVPPQTSTQSTLRLDRIFRAGPTPTQPGTDHLWIVDYKTGTHGPTGLDTFLEEQKALYSPQLEAYARTLAQLTANQPDPPKALRVALFYPTLAKLTWWEPTP